MRFDKHRPAFGAVIAFATSLLVFASGCGGGGSSSTLSSSGGSSSPTPTHLSTTCSDSNCATLTVNSGPAGGYVNGAFASATICQPGTTSCEIVGGLLVDTGSVGLRLLKSAVSSVVLAPSKLANGDALVECYPFVDSYLWGPVATADVQIGGETASGASVMLIDDSSTPSFSVPTSCSSFGGVAMPSANSLSDLGANGILGIGSTQQDCGTFCAQAANLQVSSGDFIGLYYDCSSSSSCTGTAATLAMQAPNPVSRFAKDNNGTAISLPTVAAAGVATVTGALYFGIGTESNNTMPSTASILTLDPTLQQFITTTYKETNNTTTVNTNSYIDSGSNGFFFVDPTSACPNTTADPFGSDWFCPANTLSLSATNTGANGTATTVPFNVANANTLFTTGDTAFINLAGPGTSNTFDWGLPFFYGRVVYNAIAGNTINNTGGVTFAGPFVAY